MLNFKTNTFTFSTLNKVKFLAVDMDKNTKLHTFYLYTQGYNGDWWSVKCREKGNLIILVKLSRRMKVQLVLGLHKGRERAEPREGSKRSGV